MELADLINKSFIYYENQNNKYKEYIENSVAIFDNKYIELHDKNNMEDIKIKRPFEILGIFDNDTNVWFWSWVIPYIDKSHTVLVRELLNYGLKLEPENISNYHYYLKPQLLNARILINNNIELDLHLALSSYLIKKKYMFIYPLKRYYNETNDKFQIIYYILL